MYNRRFWRRNRF